MDVSIDKNEASYMLCFFIHVWITFVFFIRWKTKIVDTYLIYVILQLKIILLIIKMIRDITFCRLFYFTNHIYFLTIFYCWCLLLNLKISQSYICANRNVPLYCICQACAMYTSGSFEREKEKYWKVCLSLSLISSEQELLYPDCPCCKVFLSPSLSL